MVVGEHIRVAREHEVHHQFDHLAGREVLTGILVVLFVELPDEFLKDVAHLVAAHAVGVKVHRIGGKLLDEQIERSFLMQGLDGVADLEPVQDIPDVLGEAVDVVDQVLMDIRRIVKKPSEIIF